MITVESNNLHSFGERRGCSENAECGVRSAECGVRSAECGVRSAECGVRSAECGVRSAECGVRSLKKMKKIEKKLKMEIREFKSDVKLRLLAHSRSFLPNQKARSAIVGAENLLSTDVRPFYAMIKIKCFTEKPLNCTALLVSSIPP